MIIHLSPQRRDDTLTVSVGGDVLTVNGEDVDLSAIADGMSLPAEATGCAWIVGDVRRVSGVPHLTLLLPHGPSPSPATAFPAPISVATDGPIAVPRDPEPQGE